MAHRVPPQERRLDPVAQGPPDVPSLPSCKGNPTLKNRWVPPIKKTGTEFNDGRRKKRLEVDINNDESKVGVSGRESTTKDGNNETIIELVVECSNTRGGFNAVANGGPNGEMNSKMATSIAVTSIQTTSPGVQKENGMICAQIKSTRTVDDKITKWLSRPKVRKIHNQINEQEDCLHVTQGENVTKDAAIDRITDQSEIGMGNKAVLLASKPQVASMAEEVPVKNIDQTLLFETSSSGRNKQSPSMVSDDGPYATEASISSSRSDQSLVLHSLILNKWPRSGLQNEADWSPMPVISTIRVSHSTKLEGTDDGIDCEVPTKQTGRGSIDCDSSSDSDTDEEEVLLWAEKMFGVTPPELHKLRQRHTGESDDENNDVPGFVCKLESMAPPASKLRQKTSTKLRKQGFSAKRKPSCDPEEEERRAAEEGKRKKEEAKPLTAAEIRAILGEDFDFTPSSHWVRRSSRQPCKAALQTPGVRALLDKLRRDDSDMVVLKMKKYVNDPDTPQVVIDAVLDALEENTNCEALYIQVSRTSVILVYSLSFSDIIAFHTQNFNRGMHDTQLLHLLKVLQLRTCKIWCINIGETYNVKSSTWKKFARGLRDTNVTHMYASEHTIDGELKDKIREIIRVNRKKHEMHCSPENLDVIVQCTHCWWNPINAKVLRPYLRSKGYEDILKDKEAQGLRGTMSGATLGVDGAAFKAV